MPPADCELLSCLNAKEDIDLQKDAFVHLAGRSASEQYGRKALNNTTP